MRPGIGISSLNKTMNKFSTDHAIFAQISSIGAAGQKNSEIPTKSPKIRSRGHFFEKRPQQGFQAKTPC
jgi:hypothetical protein